MYSLVLVAICCVIDTAEITQMIAVVIEPCVSMFLHMLCSQHELISTR